MGRRKEGASVKALIVDVIHESGIKYLQSNVDVDVKLNLSFDELQDIVGNYEILIGRSTPATPRIENPLLEKKGRLQVIGIASVGLDQVDIDYVKNQGVRLVHLPGINAVSVAEHAFALLLGSHRFIFPAYEKMKRGEWNKHGYLDARDLYGSTLGVIGLGNTGSQSVRIAKQGFNMNILAYDPYLSEKQCKERGARKISLEILLEQSDAVIIHAPLTAETYHLLGEGEIQRMKPGSTLINVGRGGIVDETALYNGLTEGPLAFAALDVQETEPLTSSPLFELPNFLATPHIAGLTQTYYHQAGVLIAKKCLEDLDSIII
jgi:D-3-phosphoglycerate dehydrogenase